MLEMLEIDGSVLEGGGQILRNAISLSAILSIPVRIFNIRAGRPKPGLAAQHLKGIILVGKMCHGKIKGAGLGSTEIEFIPNKIRGGHYFADTQTAGAISLLLQVALPVALMADGPVMLDLKGGTNVNMAPQLEYVMEVFKPMLQKFGGDFRVQIHRKGYFPKGSGHVTVNINPVKRLRSVTLLDSGTVERIKGWSYVAGNVPIEHAYKTAEEVKSQLLPKYDNVDIKCYQEDRNVAPIGSCNGVILACERSTGCVLGSEKVGGRNEDPAKLGRAVGSAMRVDLDCEACVDQHMQDQLIIYMLMAEGKSSIKAGWITLHTKTAIHVAEMMAKTKFSIQPIDDFSNIIECTGLGLFNKNLPPE